MDFSTVSDHMGTKLQALLPKIAGPNRSPPDGVATIDLSIAQNHLMKEDFLTLMKDSLMNNLSLKELSYPSGFGGSHELLEALAHLLNKYFSPSKQVEPEHIIATAGAGNALDALCCTICEPGDKVLVLGPCWEGFGPYMLINANVEPIVVTTSLLRNATEVDIIVALQNAYAQHAKKQQIKAVILTNPNNPLGKCYPADVLRRILRFCHGNGLHLISDEVYGLSRIENRSTCDSPFVSMLSLRNQETSADITSFAPKVHVIWSLSKDFGCSGIRMGCIVSQDNPAIRLACGLSSYWQTSSLAGVVTQTLLTSPELPDLMRRNSQYLGAAYGKLTKGLDALQIEYISADYGMFIFAKVDSTCHNADAESKMMDALVEKGLITAAGGKFFGDNKDYGWVRITFATADDDIEAALRILAGYRCSIETKK
ncbi:hypothetical protein QQS21_001467 [Conoideocrella luteorostrata]|uniref:Aminotransferase class I/classII large domain-containing protein n=1 Tax=Conoideocrella luteorostrata TaxID=1105319 RepID=A0AAJ0CZM3_9HYPO|nr:hypothetical protein QQS21_001467 [Conoideocrella luteorostrata]